MDDTRTEHELIVEAVRAQNACNLSGVVHSFSRDVSRLWKLAKERGEGTAWVNKHLVCRLYADKLLDLAGPLPDNFMYSNYEA